ncbi:ADP-dependent glucokinase-like [Mizuhopecten yessoensis]|uniref:ADP-dependent glucokinase n=1 Tax=Mizuhopecten yessoensis TaxID=6573 RepID=A0A210Q4J8_MIZYE|nr:ADP-dependent glucokinase-like [Mizuhopecten yessoensis]OWF43663.1 ADP-dependent glucokinase [Mizuhopecten yessoensis]
MISLRTGTLISLLVAMLAYLYVQKYHKEPKPQQPADGEQNRLYQVLSGLLRAEKKVALVGSRVALGFGGCQDILVEAMPLFNKLNIQPPTTPKHHDSVETEEELSQLLAYFFKHGAAAERYISNDTLFKELTDTSKTLPGHRLFLGGNAPVMARRLANMGAEVLLGARFAKDLINTMPDNVKIVGEVLEENDIHLLLEYKTGEHWGEYRAPRANRLIVHSDNSNPYLETLEALEKELPNFDPSILVIGGLQMMDNFPFKEGERLERLHKLKNMLMKTPKKTSIHFEMASFSDEILMQEILDNVVPYSDSLGMNEQELPNLVSMLTTGNVSLVADAYPRVASTLDEMRLIYKKLKNTEEIGGKRKLTRLHVHTLAYQAILTTKGSAWRNTMAAAAKASLTAYRHVCDSKVVDLMKARLIMDESFSTSTMSTAQRIAMQEDRPVSCWEEDDYQICIAPVLVCTNVKQTAGGGDNISSAGLIVQVE